MSLVLTGTQVAQRTYLSKANRCSNFKRLHKFPFVNTDDILGTLNSKMHLVHRNECSREQDHLLCFTSGIVVSLSLGKINFSFY